MTSITASEELHLMLVAIEVDTEQKCKPLLHLQTVQT